MRLTPPEEDRLLIFAAAELARRSPCGRAAPQPPEAVALIGDAMFEAARPGATYEAVEAAGRAAVRRRTRCSPAFATWSTRCASRCSWATARAWWSSWTRWEPGLAR